jgi:hypothetical protein
VIRGVSIKPFLPSVEIFTDASIMGWGAHVWERILSGIWTHVESSLHINCLEMLAVVKATIRTRELLSHKQVRLATDNTTVVSYVNK